MAAADHEIGAADLRAEIARHRIRLYKLGARADIHPSILSQLVNGHAPLTPSLAERISTAIRDEVRSASTRGRPAGK